MSTHVDKRLYAAAAVLGAVAIFATGFFVALGVRAVVAGPDSAPAAALPNPGHSWSEIGDLPGTMWHSNNDGPGSGLDADLLDGMHAGQSGANYIPYADASGNVGMGTTNPSVSLHNNGDFITKGPWIDVRAFGAKGDGITDDSSAIQDAIDSLAPSGGTVYIPKGTFVVNSFIRLSMSNVILEGSGKSTVLKLGNNRNHPVIVIGDYSAENPTYIVSNVEVRNLAIDGNKAEQSSEYDAEYGYLRNNGITLRRAEFCSVENVHISSCRSGGVVSEKGCKYLILDNIITESNYFDGLCLYETEISIVSNVISRNNDEAGFSCDCEFNRNIFVSLFAYDNGTYGFYHGKGDYNTISAASFIDNTLDGYVFKEDSNAHHNNLNGCYFEGNNGWGVWIADTTSRYTTISGSYFANNVDGGLGNNGYLTQIWSSNTGTSGWWAEGGEVEHTAIKMLGNLDLNSYDLTSVNKLNVDGKVGIGTTDPQSALQVNGYVQLALTSGSPPAADCNEATEEGRMKFDPGADNLYICSGASGWVSVSLT